MSEIMLIGTSRYMTSQFSGTSFGFGISSDFGLAAGEAKGYLLRKPQCRCVLLNLTRSQADTSKLRRPRALEILLMNP